MSSITSAKYTCCLQSKPRLPQEADWLNVPTTLYSKHLSNTGAWATTKVRPLLLQERAHQVRFAGGWARAQVTGSGDRVRSSANRGATATLRSRARTVQVVAPTGPNRGRAAILVNGHRVRVVDLYSPRRKARQTVATVQGLAPQTTSVVKVRVLDRKRHASKGTRVALDAFVVVR